MILYKRENKQDDPLEILLKEENKRQLKTYFTELTPRERVVIELRFGCESPLSLQAIGKPLSLSHERVRQIEKEAIEKLKKIIRRGKCNPCNFIAKNSSANIVNTPGCHEQTKSGNVPNVNRHVSIYQEKNQKLAIRHLHKEHLKEWIKHCQICGEPNENPEVKKGFVIDHDHKTGRIRGVLCRNCNQLLGAARDNVTRLQKAIAYLSRDFSKNEFY